MSEASPSSSDHHPFVRQAISQAPGSAPVPAPQQQPAAPCFSNESFIGESPALPQASGTPSKERAPRNTGSRRTTSASAVCQKRVLHHWITICSSRKPYHRPPVPLPYLRRSSSPPRHASATNLSSMSHQPFLKQAGSPAFSPATPSKDRAPRNTGSWRANSAGAVCQNRVLHHWITIYSSRKRYHKPPVPRPYLRRRSSPPRHQRTAHPGTPDRGAPPTPALYVRSESFITGSQSLLTQAISQAPLRSRNCVSSASHQPFLKQAGSPACPRPPEPMHRVSSH